MVEVTRVLTHHFTEPVHLEVRLPTPVQRVHGLYTQQQHSPVPRVVFWVARGWNDPLENWPDPKICQRQINQRLKPGWWNKQIGRDSFEKDPKSKFNDQPTRAAPGAPAGAFLLRCQVPAPNGNHRIMFSRLGVWTGRSTAILSSFLVSFSKGNPSAYGKKANFLIQKERF